MNPHSERIPATSKVVTAASQPPSLSSVNSANTTMSFQFFIARDSRGETSVIRRAPENWGMPSATGTTHLASIANFGPEPYELKEPIPVVIKREGNEYTASFVEANINSSGESELEAIELLKDLILSRHDRLRQTDDSKLGHHPLRQKQILVDLIRAL